MADLSVEPGERGLTCRGLLPPSGRSPGGYRLYTEPDLGRLDFVRLKRELERRRQDLARRPPTDHGSGYCSCFSGGLVVIPPTAVRRKHGRARPATTAGGRARRA